MTDQNPNDPFPANPSRQSDQDGSHDMQWSDDEPFDDSPAWDESFYEIVEQIDRGQWPIKLPMAVELRFENGRPRVQVARPAMADEPADPRRMIMRVNCQVDQARLCQIVLERIASAAKRGESQLAGLALLSRIDQECFLETAAAHFANLPHDMDDTLRDDPALAGFLQDLHERGPDLIGEMIERTGAHDPAAGERLREVVLDAINEPPCRDELGLLAVAELVARLEAG